MIEEKMQIKFILLVSVMSTACLFGGQLKVKSYVDKNIVTLGNQFTLFVELSGKDAKNSIQPVLPDLKEFAVYLGSGSSQSIQFINGKMSATKTLQYQYQAVKEGSFIIGQVKIESSGNTLTTTPITIQILNRGTNQQKAKSAQSSGKQYYNAKDLFLKAEPNKHAVFKNEPLLIVYKIYTRVNVSSFGFQKMPETTGFWVEDFTKGQSQPATSSEIINGVRYTVATIKKMALFPMAAGIKTVNPMVIVCSVRVKNRSNDVFDSFFDDPFGRQVNKSIASEPVKVKVLQLPDEGKPAEFSGIVGNFVLSSLVDKRNVSANEAVTFKVVVKGSGNLKTFPEPKITFPPGFEVYPPKVSQNISLTSNIVHGTKTFEYVLIPREPGLKKIPQIKIPIFNPAKRKYELLSTKLITLNVSKSKKKYEEAAHTGLTKEEIRLVGKDIRFIKTECQSFNRINTGSVNLWFWLLIFTPVLGIFSALLYRKHLDKLSSDEAYARGHRSGKVAKKRFARARSFVQANTQKEFYDEAGKALLGFVADKLNISEAGLITKDARNILENKRVSKSTINEYFECIAVCDMKRFSPEKSSIEEMKLFIKRAEKAIDDLSREI